MKKFLALLATVSLAVIFGITAPVPAAAQNTASQLSRVAAKYVATNYASWRSSVVSGPSVASTAAIIVTNPQALVDGRTIFPFSVTAPVTVDGDTETPTAVSAIACPSNAQATNGCTSITAAWAAGHPGGQNNVSSGTFGLQEAMNDANGYGGGTVAVDNTWFGTDAMIQTSVPYGNVQIEDTRKGIVQYWTPNATSATVIAAMPTLTATTVGFGLNGANTTGGFYTGASTYHVATACVDVMGKESQPSADFSGLTAGSGTTNQIGFLAPVAQTGCVGYVPYISLGGGTYALAYRVPLATYVNGNLTSTGVCTLTTIETITAACKIANTTYGQTGSNAIVSALTVNTARIWVGVGGTSSTSDVVGNSGARQAYAMTPGIHVGTPGTGSVELAYTAATAPATTVPAIVGTIHLLPNYMNFIGRTIRICGTLKENAGSTATVETIGFYWDADGSNATGAGVLITGPTITTTLSATPNFQFCQDLTTTVSGAGATAGSIQATQGYITAVNGAAGTVSVTTPTVPGAAIGSLNLAGEARIDIDYLHTTGTDGTVQLLDLSVLPIS